MRVSDASVGLTVGRLRSERTLGVHLPPLKLLPESAVRQEAASAACRIPVRGNY
jgi:hypothetical protein